MNDKIAVNIVRVTENGPLELSGQLNIGKQDAESPNWLCRCGASQNKPFCDGSHRALGFTDAGEPVARESPEHTTAAGTLTVTPQRDGPLRVSGVQEVHSNSGRTLLRATETWLCRCGKSGLKPYCDGSHRKAGFKAP